MTARAIDPLLVAHARVVANSWLFVKALQACCCSTEAGGNVIRFPPRACLRGTLKPEGKELSRMSENKEEPFTFEQLQARAEKRDRDDLLGCRAIRISWGGDLGTTLLDRDSALQTQLREPTDQWALMMTP
jgi:hypothetical protein